MKTTLLFLSVFLSVSLFAQNVYIPDANFKAYLVGNAAINANGDTEIQVSEATAFTRRIPLDELGITDLTGIEAFTALTYLICHGNQITSLDVSQNNALIKLYCQENLLTSLDVSQNPTLSILTCQNNQLTCLNMANGIVPYILECYNNINLTCIESDIISPVPFTGNWSLQPNVSFSEDCNNDCSTASLTELTTSKNLIQILDLMGRETSFKPNTPLIYVYDDGSIEKVFSVEY